MVFRTVKRAKKGIYTTVKLTKRAAKGSETEEQIFMAWFFMLKLVFSVALKTGKHMIRKGKMPKFNFVKKHMMRAAGYATLLPILLVAVIQLIQLTSPSHLNYLKYVLIIYWISSTVYKEVIVGKPKKNKAKTDTRVPD